MESYMYFVDKLTIQACPIGWNTTILYINIYNRVSMREEEEKRNAIKG